MPISLPAVGLPTWSATKTTSKKGFDKAWQALDKLGAPVNALSNKIGSEAFWPTTLDKESDKAARILRSFCKDGFYVEEAGHTQSRDAPKGRAKVIKKIPTKVIREAKGLAIFTTMRTGLWVSGAGGSGILVGRTPRGEWSPPSGIMLHTAGLGFLVGVDIYDCVVVINSEKALQAFTKLRCTLGGEISAVAGPVGVGGVLETEIHKRQAPIWTYLKSRGFYAGVQVDGTVIIERTDENERFYGERIGVSDILAGKVRHPPYELKTLMATLKAAQGDSDVDEAALPAPEPTPGDMEIVESTGFGLPPPEDDPDPFGVKALEQEGMEIREAGTQNRPSTEAFEYRPSPSSPIYSSFGRRHSLDSKHSKRDSGRLSIASTNTDRGTQTEILGLTTTESPRESRNHSPDKKISENLAEEPEEDISLESSDHAQPNGGFAESPTAPSIISKARLVTIPKRIPPALPPRNPYRSQAPVIINPDLANNNIPTPNSTQDHATDPRSPSPPPGPSHLVANDLTPRSKSLENGVEEIHLTPRPTDSDHLSPSLKKEDGFDEVSMSGSDYSHEAPISMHDNEHPINSSAPKAAHEADLEVPHANEVVGDEFHSVPSTPVEGGMPGAFGHEPKDEFS